MSVRTPPTAAIFAQHADRPKGHCRWCGLAIIGGGGQLAKRCKWHDHCLTEYKLLAWPAETRKAVWKRDAGVCLDCGAAPSYRDQAHDYGSGAPTIVTITCWHVDHKVPLWKVAHLPDRDRIRYFQLDNLCTRCEECHKRKTSEEAAERAHIKRLIRGPSDKAKKPWPPGRKFESRPFQRRAS